MKLKYKLSAIIFFLILIVSLSNYQLLTQTFQTLQVKRLESAEALLGQSLATKLYRMVIEEQKEIVIATLFNEKILRENKLDYIVVNDREGKLFAHTYLTDVPNEIYRLNNQFSDQQNHRIDDLLTNRLEVYNIGVPIREGIIQVGTLHVGIGKDFITDAISPLKKASQKTVLFSLFTIVLGGGLAFALSFYITQSLTRLEEWAQKLSRGEYDAEIVIKSNDEVGALAGSFMQMRNKIQDAHNKLEKQNQNLEALVDERTQDLAQNNEELVASHEQLKELNRDLDEQRKNLKIVFSAMDYPLFVINRDYTIAMMNDMAKKLVQEDSSQPLTCHAVSHMSNTPCSGADHTCPLQAILETKQPVTIEHQHKNDRGEQFQVEVRGYPIFDDQGNVVQMVESCIDISEKKKAEQEKLQLERELSRAQKLESIGTLAAGVAHEINTPIQFIGDNTMFAVESVSDLFGVISKYKELLNQVDNNKEVNIPESIKEIDEEGDVDYLRKELPDALMQTKDGIDHVGTIVKAMKDFSHVGSQGNMEYTNVNEVIETTLTISKNEWKYVAEIEKNLPSDLPLVNCYLGEIKQVLLNLVVNAAHAIAEKQKSSNGDGGRGTISVITSVEDDRLKVSITDSGMGVAENHRGKLFDPFYTTKGVSEGTGQGLSVAYQIITERHGGEIGFETEIGKGSTFYFYLNLG